MTISWAKLQFSETKIKIVWFIFDEDGRHLDILKTLKFWIGRLKWM